jgi:hypothetical protein
VSLRALGDNAGRCAVVLGLSSFHPSILYFVLFTVMGGWRTLLGARTHLSCDVSLPALGDRAGRCAMVLGLLSFTLPFCILFIYGDVWMADAVGADAPAPRCVLACLGDKTGRCAMVLGLSFFHPSICYFVYLR